MKTNTMKKIITSITLAIAIAITCLTPAATTSAASYKIFTGDNSNFYEVVGQKITITVYKQSGNNKEIKISPKNYKKEKITFKSSNTKIATVDSKGTVTTKKAGTVTITVNSKYGKTKIIYFVCDYYVDNKVSLRGKTLDLSKKYTESQIVSLFGKYSRKSSKYYTTDYSQKSKSKNGYYISYTDDYHEFMMFEFVNNKLANIYTSADSFKCGNVTMGLKKDFASLKGIHGRGIYDKFGNDDLQLVKLEIIDSFLEPYMGGGYYEYKKGLKAPSNFTVPKDLYLMEMDFINALRAKHMPESYIGYLTWSDKAQKACKQHVDYLWKHDEYTHDASDGYCIGERLSKLVKVEDNYMNTNENLGPHGENPFQSVGSFYVASIGHRSAMLSATKYYGMYNNTYAAAHCFFGKYYVDHTAGDIVDYDFEDPAFDPWYDETMANYTGPN